MSSSRPGRRLIRLRLLVVADRAADGAADVAGDLAESRGDNVAVMLLGHAFVEGLARRAGGGGGRGAGGLGGIRGGGVGGGLLRGGRTGGERQSQDRRAAGETLAEHGKRLRLRPRGR